MDEKIIEQKESIKLTKNAKGEYQWEIKILSSKNDLDTLEIEKLEKLNEELENKFGGK